MSATARASTALDAAAAALPGLFVAGSGFESIGIPDCVANGRAHRRTAAADYVRMESVTFAKDRVVASIAVLAVQRSLAAARSTGGSRPARRASRAASRRPDVSKLLAEIKAKDKGQLAVSEEDGRFLRLMIASSGAQARARDRRRQRLQRDLDGAWDCARPAAGW